MIAIWVVWFSVVTVLLAGAALALERALRLVGAPSRFAWAFGLVASLSLGIVSLRSTRETSPSPAPVRAAVRDAADLRAPRSLDATVPSGHSVSSGDASAVSAARASAWRIPIATDSRLRAADRPLAVLLILSALVGIAVVTWSALRLRRASRAWTPTVIDGREVFVSDRFGPAVVGVVRSRIVVPAWAMDLATVDRALILEHETEHLRAGDPRLLFASLLSAALIPWSAAAWWMVKRMRLAVEIDCDARVLRARPDRRRYGALLLDIGERSNGLMSAATGMAEPVELLEQRITAMTEQAGPSRGRVALGWLGIVLALGFAACMTPRPTTVPAAERPVTVRPIDSLRVDVPVDIRGFEAALRSFDSVVTQVRPIMDSTRLVFDTLTFRLDSMQLRDYLTMKLSMDTLLIHLDSMVVPDSSFLRLTLDSIAFRDYRQMTLSLDSLIVRVDPLSPTLTTALRVSTQPDLGASGCVGLFAARGGYATTGSARGDFYSERSFSRMRDSLRRTAERLHPDAFARKDDSVVVVGMVIDSTGAVVRHTTQMRQPTYPGDDLCDGPTISRLFPDVRPPLLTGTGAMNAVQNSAKGIVVVAWAFLGPAPRFY